MARIAIDALGKDAPGSRGAPPVRILDGVTLDVAEGEFLVLVGPSGCGKTTLLRCIAGLEEITRGELRFDDQRVNDLAPRDRDVAMVFQSYALYPHLTVRDNLAFALKMKKTAADEIGRRVEEAARMLEIAHLLERYPRQLSGGQRQRVAMGRAVVRRPRAFLFDEPLSNLDASLRGQMRVELKRLHARLGATMVYVTHDQVEAMTLADRIALLNRGVVEQVGAPDELYRRPKTLFAARFFGSPEMNAVAGTIESHGGLRFRAPGFDLPLPANIPAPTGACTLGVRAEDLRFVDAGRHITARVDVLENLGWECLVHLETVSPRGEAAGGDAALHKGVSLVARIETAKAPRVGEAVGLQLDMPSIHLYASDGSRIGP